MSKTSRVFKEESDVDLFAGFPVRNYEVSVSWYNQLLGCKPAFLPNDIEAVWELSEHRYFFIYAHPEQAGHAYNLVFLSDIDDFMNQASGRGIEPAEKETLQNGTRKIIYHDPDGNKVAFGGSSTA